MNIQIKDSVGFSEQEMLLLVHSLFKNRSPQDGGLNYGGESHFVYDHPVGVSVACPIFVRQENKRKSNKSPIVITIEYMQHDY